MLRTIVCAVLLAGCASHPRVSEREAYPTSERAEEAVERMKDEFNQLFPNS